jgi:alkanesulfonate monooxygenase SsuD/methylene tetrahydromethanopterin reductase-like flavin-dependent oxidoreductase (luciferase family)
MKKIHVAHATTTAGLGPPERRRERLARAADVGLDHLFVADHVSFHGGFGMDGLTEAAMQTAIEPRLPVYVGVYLLALRRVVPVARQIATLCEAYPGRLILGVGVGGEDRHEMEVSEIDPATRGRRTDACLATLRELLTGEPVTVSNEFFSLEAAIVRPAPDPPVPITVGGRSPAALRRAATLGDGWLGVWVSPERYASNLAEIDDLARASGREVAAWRHGLQLWAGVDADRDRARTLVADAMERFYRIPFEKFERTTPFGTAEDVAEFLVPYARAGAVDFNVTATASSPEASET